MLHDLAAQDSSVSLAGGRVLFVQKVAVSLLHRSIDETVTGSG
jgi:hypothetical protein